MSQAPALPLTVPDAAWVEQARLSLASAQAQLDQVNTAEAAWQKLPESRRARIGPHKAQELAEHKKRLLGHQAALSTALDAQTDLPQTRKGLADTQRQLDKVDSALQAQTSSPPDSLTKQLTDQRDMLTRETESLRQEQTRRERTVNAATVIPLPTEADAKNTTTLVDQVLALTRPEPRRPEPNRPDGTKPVAAQPGRDAPPKRVRGDSTTSAPPHPRVKRGTSDRPKVAVPRTPVVANPAAPNPAAPKPVRTTSPEKPAGKPPAGKHTAPNRSPVRSPNQSGKPDGPPDRSKTPKPAKTQPAPAGHGKSGHHSSPPRKPAKSQPARAGHGKSGHHSSPPHKPAKSQPAPKPPRKPDHNCDKHKKPKPPVPVSVKPDGKPVPR